MGAVRQRQLKYTDSGNAISQSQIEEVVKSEVEKYFKTNKIPNLIISKDTILQIEDIYNNYLKNSLKEMDKPIEKVLGGVYSQSFGYGNVIQKYKILENDLEKTLKQVYIGINKLSTIIRNKSEVDYEVFFRVLDDKNNEDYFSIKIKPEDIINLYTIDKTKKSIEGLNSMNKIIELLGYKDKKELLQKTKNQELYYQHLKKFMNIIVTEFNKEQQERQNKGLKYHKDFNYGYAYEAFNWHLKYFKEEPTYDENGLIKDWEQKHSRMPARKKLLAGYFASIGNAKFSSGGDVDNTQLKSVQLKIKNNSLKITSSFGVSSYEQLLNSINLLLVTLKGKESLTQEEVTKLILAFNDIQHDASITTYNKLTKVVDDAIDNIFSSLQGDPNIVIEAN